jgi:hypothetical protein
MAPSNRPSWESTSAGPAGRLLAEAVEAPELVWHEDFEGLSA